MPNVELGKPFWHDLTVKDTAQLIPFYEAVCNWKTSEHDMGEYADFNMTTQDGDTVAGLCHARQENANLPPVWLMYVAVPSLREALAKVEALGGKVVDQRTAFAVVCDPAGAHLALWEANA